MSDVMFDDEAVQLMLKELQEVDLPELKKKLKTDQKVAIDIAKLQIAIWFYQHGMRCEIPPEWQKGYIKIYREVMKKRNPDYQAYMKLKRKFSD